MKNERGVVLLLVIVFSLILSIIGIAAIENAGQQQIQNKNLLSENRAHQIAYGGIELGKNYILQCKNAFNTIDVEAVYERFPEHISGNRNPIIVPIPPMFTQAIQSQGSLSVSIIPDTGNITQVFLPATDQNICKSIYGAYTISSTATITSGIPGTLDVIKNESIRVCAQRVGYFSNVYKGTGYVDFYLAEARSDFTMTSLGDDKILVAGGVRSGTYVNSAELYVYDSIFFQNTASMNIARAEHTATLLGSGDILVAGGTNGAGSILSSAEIYKYDNSVLGGGTFSLTANPMMVARYNACAAPLTDGNALIAGGYSTGGAPTSSAEVYSTATGKFNFTSSMALPRAGAAAVRLNNGSVLIVGGIQATGVYAPQAEVYTYPAGVFTLVGALAEPRYQPTATLLDDGTVLVCGGYTGNSHLPLTAEIYNPATHTFTPTTGAPIHSRFGATATLLYSGQVLITGGIIDSATGPTVTDSAELYNPIKKIFTPVESYDYVWYDFIYVDEKPRFIISTLLAPRAGHQAMILGGITPGWVVTAGGSNGTDYLSSAERFTPILDTEEIKNSYVEGPIIRKTH